MPITFEVVHTCISIQNTNAHAVLDDSHKYFTFVSHICDPFSIPYLVVVMFVCFFFFFIFLQMPMMVYCNSKNSTLKLYTHVYIHKMLLPMEC